MNKPLSFTLPPPNFNKNHKDACKPKPHFLTPSGMSLLPREKQPPPMYGKHGATVPGRYLPQQPSNNWQQQQTKKTPVEKQYCESCELEFHSVDDLKRHRAQHEKCPVAGCNYKGHPTVMDKHINALHSSGLFEKFKKLSTPEEIAAWREERRKRYPTLANVLLKQKAQEQRQKRGERLEACKNRFGKVNDRKRAQPNTTQDKNQNESKKSKEDNVMNNKNNRRNRKNKRKQIMKTQEKIPVQQTEGKKNIEESQVQEDINAVRCGIKMFAGTSQLKDYNHLNDKRKGVKNNVLFGLVGMYGSDNDDDDDESDQDDGEDIKPKETELHGNNLELNEKSDNIRQNIANDKEFIESVKRNTEVVQLDNTINENKDLKLSTQPYEMTTNEINSEENNRDKSLSNDTLEMKNNELNLEQKLSGLLNVDISSNVNDGNFSDEGPEEVPIQKTSTELPLKTVTTSNPDLKVEPQAKRSKLEEQPTSTLKQRLLTKRKSGLDYRKIRLRKQNTMLEKLLEADIRHERNILLQCVRYVCENNFFGVGQTSPEKPG